MAWTDSHTNEICPLRPERSVIVAGDMYKVFPISSTAIFFSANTNGRAGDGPRQTEAFYTTWMPSPASASW